MKTNGHCLNICAKVFSLPAGMALASMLTVCPMQARADTIALSFSGGTAFQVMSTQATVGWAFSLSGSILLTQLGVWDMNGDGLFNSHQVTVWDNTTMTLVAQITIPSGTSATLDNGFRYVSIAPVALAPGNYTIGGLYGGVGPRDLDSVADSAATITTASGVTYNGSRSGVGDAFPSGDAIGAANSYFGPNFQFTGLPTNGVPDAGLTWQLLLSGLTSVGGLKFLIRGRLSLK